MKWPGRKWMSRWVALAAVVLCLFAVGVASAEDPTKLPRPETAVADFAGVIDAASKYEMERLGKEMATKAGATMIVVTVKSLDGLEIEDFTTKLQANWHVGAKKTDRGILMVFAIAEHKRRIEVGYGLEGILNDAKTGDIGRGMVPQLKAGEYGPAALQGMQAMATVIAEDAKITLDPSEAPPEPTHTYHREVAPRHSFMPSLWLIIVVVVLLLRLAAWMFGVKRSYNPGAGTSWWMLLLAAAAGRRRGGGGDGFGGGGFGGGDSGGGGSDSSFGGGDFGGDSGGGGSSGDW